MSTPTHLSIPLETVQRVLEYLQEKPFKEVAAIFMELKQAADKSFIEQQKKEE